MMIESQYDVVVSGGGVGGMSAALTAARCGAKTLLLEKRAELGGTLRAGLGFPVCGLFDAHANLLNGGFTRELFDAFDVEPERMGRVYVWPCPSAKLLALFENLLSREARLSVSLRSAVDTVEVADGRMVAVAVAAGGAVVRPKAVVDCTGDGAIVQASAAGQLVPEAEVLAGYVIRFDGVADHPMLSLKVPLVLRKADLPDYLGFSTFMPPAGIKLAVPPGIGDVELKRDVERICTVLAAALPAFEKAKVVETSAYVMPREGIRLKGRYVLSKADVLSGARFEDAVAACAWPVEYWDAEGGQRFEYPAGDRAYEIPLRCLQSAEIENLLAAGRCLSASSEALASARVMGTCIATGEAAGKAAAKLCA